MYIKEGFMKKIISIVIMVVLVYQSVGVCAQERESMLRPPSQASSEEFEKKFILATDHNLLDAEDHILDIDIKWVTRKVPYDNTEATIPPIMKNNITQVLFNTSNNFLRETISKHLRSEIKIEDVGNIREMEIRLFQLGKHNHILRVSTFLELKKIVFGLVIANNDASNQGTENDFANINLLRERLPRFTDLLQNPYALDNSSSLSMFSCEWFDDYYELGIRWSDRGQGIVFYINDPRGSSEGTDFDSSEAFNFTREGTVAIIEEISRMFTIFFDEERQQSIDLSCIRIQAGDFTHYKERSNPKVKLMTVMNIKKNQNLNNFITALMNLEEDWSSLFIVFNLSFSSYQESVAKGILRGLQDKYGKKEGEERFRIWCDNCPLLKSSATSLITALSSSIRQDSKSSIFTLSIDSSSTVRDSI